MEDGFDVFQFFFGVCFEVQDQYGSGVGGVYQVLVFGVVDLYVVEGGDVVFVLLGVVLQCFDDGEFVVFGDGDVDFWGGNVVWEG